MIPDDRPVVLRALRAFEGSLPPKVAELRDDFWRARRAFVDHLRERLALVGVVWETDDPELLGALLPRVEWLAGEITRAREAMRDAVDLGEAVRGTGLLSMRGEPSLSATRSLVAIHDGQRDMKALESPLTDADRARIRRRRS